MTINEIKKKTIRLLEVENNGLKNFISYWLIYTIKIITSI